MRAEWVKKTQDKNREGTGFEITTHIKYCNSPKEVV
jgi:hypothetical protein